MAERPQPPPQPAQASDAFMPVPATLHTPSAVEPAANPSTLKLAMDESQAAGQSPLASLAPPRIAGFEILEELGRGAMGVVYKARQLRPDRVVAIKMVLAGSHAGPEELDRFDIEARALARFQHPGIVRILELGEHEGLPFLVMEYIAGGSLAKRLGGKPQPVRSAVVLVETLARAVHAAHERGIIHRDLKPGNVLLARGADAGSPDPLFGAAPLITDFGLARFTETGSGHTQTGMVMGTPSYMAPEQAGGVTKKLTPAVDVYALGAILYELLTGQPPFREATPMETVLQVLQTEPLPPRRLRPELPRDLENICLKCLQKEPRNRYPDAAALADDLRRFLEHRPTVARPVGMVERARKWSRRRPAAAAFAVVALAALLLGGLIWLWYWDAYLRVKVAYYANWLRTVDGWEGVGELTPEEVGRRNLSFKFYRRGGKLERVEFVNGSGFPPAQPEDYFYVHDFEKGPHTIRRAAALEIRRDAKGQIKEEVLLDPGGRILYKFLFSKDDVAQYIDAKGFSYFRGFTNVSHLRFIWTDEGRVAGVQYVNSGGTPTPAEDGCYGFCQELDNRGQPRTITYIDAAGSPCRNTQGYARVNLEYDARGYISRLTYQDENRQPVRHKLGFFQMHREYDAAGNLARLRFLDQEGKPFPLADGRAIIEWDYDDRGNRLCERVRGGDGRLADWMPAERRIHYDKRGWPTATRFYDASGAAALDPAKGYHGVNIKYDDIGQEREINYLGIDEKPVVGQGRTEQIFDEDGKLTSKRFYDENNQLRRPGYAYFQAAYDRRGEEWSVEYFDADGQPTTGPEGAFRVETEWNDKRWLVRTAFRDVDGNLVRATAGKFAVAIFEHDEYGRPKAVEYRDEKGNLTLHAVDGFARREMRVDMNWKPLEIRYLGVNRQPIPHREGNFALRAKYDAYGNTIWEEYLDAQGQPMLNRLGYAYRRQTYDAYGQATGVEFFDIDKLPARHKDGYLRIRREFVRGVCRKEILEGFDGSQGYAACVIEPAVDSPVRTLSYWKADGTVLRHDNGATHCTQRHVDGIVRELEYSGYLAETGVAFCRVRLNHRGQCEEEVFLDAGRQPVSHLVFGFARFRPIYDALGREHDADFFDADGHPVSVHVLVDAVAPNGPGSHSGIRVNDVLVEYAGQPVTSVQRFLALRRLTETADREEMLVVLRDGQRHQLRVPAAGMLQIRMVHRGKRPGQ